MSAAAPHDSPPAEPPLSVQRYRHDIVDPHGRATWLSEAILGGQDGIVNVLGIVLGVAVAGTEARVVLAAGCAAALAESVSMAAVAYTSTRAANDVFAGERAREHRHVRAAPGVERDELRAIFQGFGFSDALLERAVEAATRDEDVWVAIMMAHEHHLEEGSTRKSLGSAVLVGLAALVGSCLPLAPFAALSREAAPWAAVAVAASALFALGAYKARRTGRGPVRDGVELTAIGLVSAAIGSAIGLLFRAP